MALGEGDLLGPRGLTTRAGHADGSPVRERLREIELPLHQRYRVQRLMMSFCVNRVAHLGQFGAVDGLEEGHPTPPPASLPCCMSARAPTRNLSAKALPCSAQNLWLQMS